MEELLLALLGAAVALYFVFHVVHFFYRYFFQSSLSNLRVYGAKTGDCWAVVTGASDGIGKAFAEVLAHQGFHLIVVSRTESKLQELQKTLEEKYNIDVKYVAIDASSVKDCDANIQKITSLAQSLTNVSLLINNVGVNTDIPVEFVEMSDEDIEKQLQVNVVFTTKLTKSFIPILMRNNGLSGPKRSGILNLGSISAEFPSAPLMSVYAASKAYLKVWSRSLYVELRSKNVDVLSVSPAYVISAMSGFKKTSFLVRSGKEVAEASLSKLGKMAELTPSWQHQIQRAIITKVPFGIWSSYLAGMMKGIRARALKKKAQ